MKQTNFCSRLLLMAGLMVCTLGMSTSCGGSDDDVSPEPTPEPIFENKTVTAGGVTFTMVAVVGGTFQMGAPDSDADANNDEKPQHAVTLSDYYIAETEVT